MRKQKQLTRYRLGVDVGGTHTDFILNDLVKRTITIKKLASSPENPALAVLEGLKSLIKEVVNPAEIDFFSHGTTVTTNALLEGKGAKVGVLINQGFRAICEVQTQARDQGNPFDHLFQRPQHITPPSLSYEIPGGKIDDKETPEDAAIRECFEETGVKCNNLKPLISYQPSLDIWKNYTRIFLSEEFSHFSEDKSENHVWIPMEHCIEMIFSEQIVDGLSIIVLLAYHTKINKS